MMSSPRPKLLLGLTLAGMIGISVACSDARTDTSGASASGGSGSATANGCATPQTGCACSTPGLQIPCGRKLTGDQSFVYCYEGLRTCQSTGVYGECEDGTVVAHSSAALSTRALAPNSNACSQTVTGNYTVCTSGRNVGDNCTTNADCGSGRKKCTGSSDSTQDCQDDGDCNNVCTGFNGSCSGGTTPNIGCNTSADCAGGGTCSIPGGSTCGTYSGICDSSDATDGKQCSSNADCGTGVCQNTARGYCSGGRRNGHRCQFHKHCKGGGTCSADLGDGGATSGAIDPCDPYCQVFSDTPLGFDAGGAFTMVDGGITPNFGCGNGVVNPGEQCDDGNAVAGDGCSSACKLEVGFYCPTPGSACLPSTCGNGIQEGLEQCDDNNTRPYDGCSPTCTKEPDCPANVDGCNAVCGDGIKFPGEACDDGNLTDGDGCSSMCTIEAGATCTVVTAASPPSIDVPVIFRDFTPNTHPDFQKVGSGPSWAPHRVPPVSPWYFTSGQNCPGGTQRGIPSLTLSSADREPVLRTAPDYLTGAEFQCTADATYFSKWFRDDPAFNKVIVGRVLRLNKTGAVYEFDSSNDTITTAGVNCGNGSAGSDCKSQTGFYPLNSMGWGNYTAGKNYHFTSEVRYPFTYAGGETLSFTGDDDVFVYVNNKLIVDLGGIHVADSKTVTLANTTTLDDGKPSAHGTVSLTPGKTYEIVVFQTERNTTGSNYKLTLGSFNRPTSSCTVPPPPAVIVRDFQAMCKAGEKPVWQLFRWKAGMSGTDQIVFRAATRSTQAALPTSAGDATAVNIGTATSANNPTTWSFDADPVSKHLKDAGQVSESWLRVFMTFNGSSPVMSEWQQLYDCISVE